MVLVGVVVLMVVVGVIVFRSMFLVCGRDGLFRNRVFYGGR